MSTHPKFGVIWWSRGERAQRNPILCSPGNRRYLYQGCSRFVSYIIDTREHDKATIEEVPVIHESPDVFPEDLPGVPSKRQVELRIDLVPDATPIAKAPYRLDPQEMQELSTHLKEPLDKGFIRLSSSLWGALILFVKKKDGSHWMCIDY